MLSVDPPDEDDSDDNNKSVVSQIPIYAIKQRMDGGGDAGTMNHVGGEEDSKINPEINGEGGEAEHTPQVEKEPIQSPETVNILFYS